MKDLRFAAIQEALVDIATGIGQGSANLTALSQSPVGTLAVKTAEVVIDFEMTSNAFRREGDLTLPALGVKSLTFAVARSGEEKRDTNRGKITLQIVSVLPQPKQEAVVGVGPAVIAWIRNLIPKLHVAEEVKKAMLADLKLIEDLLAKKDTAAASAAFIAFLNKYHAFLTGTA